MKKNKKVTQALREIGFDYVHHGHNFFCYEKETEDRVFTITDTTGDGVPQSLDDEMDLSIWHPMNHDGTFDHIDTYSMIMRDFIENHSTYLAK